MKTLVPIISATTALLLLAGTTSRGQETAERNQAVAQAAQARAQMDQAEALATQAQAQADQQQLGRLKQARGAYQLAQADASTGVGVSTGRRPQPFTERLTTVIGRVSAGPPSRTLVIRSADTDVKAQANLEEDLAVMSRIFEKALGEKLGSPQPGRPVMGIDVLTIPGASPIRSLYLDGYGALFMVNVGFPLLAPPARTEPPKEEAPAGSTWEEAKRELYGPRSQPKSVPAPVEEYSEEKVSKLKDALLESLKNAANIRNLKSDDLITVCVFGGASAAPAKTTTLRLVPMEETAVPPSATVVGTDNRTRQRLIQTTSDDGASTRGSILTIRVEKTDADAFAKGKLTLDEFRKKANITTYAGDSGGWGAGAALIGSRSLQPF